MTDSTDIAREALELAEKATPGPWRGSHLDERVIAGPDVGGDPFLIALIKDSSRAMHHYGEHCVPNKATGKANARFINFAREALPTLARALLSRDEEVKRLAEELDSANGALTSRTAEAKGLTEDIAKLVKVVRTAESALVTVANEFARDKLQTALDGLPRRYRSAEAPAKEMNRG